MTGSNMINALGAVGSYPAAGDMATAMVSYAAKQSYDYGMNWAQQQAGRVIYDMISGNAAKKRKNETCIETNAKNGKGKVKRRAVTDQAPTSILKDCRNILGSEGVESQQQIATPLSMKLGRRQFVNPIPTFLANLSGTGTVRSEWNGILNARVDQRTGFMTLFRHRLAKTTGTGTSEVAPFTSDAYPAVSIVGDILMPTAPNALVLPVHATPAGTGTQPALTLLLAGSTYDHTRVNSSAKQVSEVCWAPLNRPDYEDMSWNMNHLRLAVPSTTFNSATGDDGFPDSGAKAYSYFTQDHALLQANKHRKMSNIEQNNVRSPSTVQGAPYKYNMVFNYGTIHYYFMNKESNGAKVEIIVYKHKKNHYAPTLAASDQAAGLGGNSNSTGYALDSIKTPIGIGYLSTKMKLLGTDDLEGRTPLALDIWSNPNYPLLPKLRQTTQSDLPWTEVMRNVFILPAGGRRAVDVQLPGEVYDPASTVLARQPTSAPSASVNVYQEQSYGLWDEHTYGVVICVNGVPTTRDIHTADGKIWAPNAQVPPQWSNPYHLRGADYLNLDCHCVANVQYYCSYTEHLSACVYKAQKKNQIFIRGDAINPPTIDGTLTDESTLGFYVGKDITDPAVTMEGCTVLPSTRTVRVAQNRSTTATAVSDSGLAHTVSQTGGHKGSVSLG